MVRVLSLQAATSAGSDPSESQLRTTAQIFFGLLVIYSALCALLYRFLSRGVLRHLLLAADQRAPCAAESATSTAGATTTPALPLLGDAQGVQPVDKSVATMGTLGGAVARLAALVRAARAGALPPALCQFLVFGITFVAWPSVPFAACREGWAESLGKSWWAQMVILAYNVPDFMSRLWLRKLQESAQRLSGSTLVKACLVRAMLLPFIMFVCVSPRYIHGGAGNAVILLVSVLLALSNGYLATVSMIQASAAVPLAMREDSINVAVAFLYLGIAGGQTISWAVGKYSMHLNEITCPGS